MGKKTMHNASSPLRAHYACKQDGKPQKDNQKGCLGKGIGPVHGFQAYEGRWSVFCGIITSNEGAMINLCWTIDRAKVETRARSNLDCIANFLFKLPSAGQRKTDDVAVFMGNPNGREPRLC